MPALYQVRILDEIVQHSGDIDITPLSIAYINARMFYDPQLMPALYQLRTMNDIVQHSGGRYCAPVDI